MTSHNRLRLRTACKAGSLLRANHNQARGPFRRDGEGDGGAAATSGGASGTPAGGGGAGTSSTHVSIPHSEMAKIRQKERTKGRAAALAEYAKKQGYESVEAMEAAHKAARDEGGASARDRGNGSGNGNGRGGQGSRDRERQEPGEEVAKLQKQVKALEKEVADLTGKNKALAADKARAETRVRELKRSIDEAKADAAVLSEASAAGITDTDTALLLVKRHYRGLSEAERQNFKSEEYLAGLKKTRPALFVAPVVETPANTGAGGRQDAAGEGGAQGAQQRTQSQGARQPPPPPKGQNQAPANGEGKGKHALKMTDAEYAEAKRLRGLTDTVS